MIYRIKYPTLTKIVAAFCCLLTQVYLYVLAVRNITYLDHKKREKTQSVKSTLYDFLCEYEKDCILVKNQLKDEVNCDLSIIVPCYNEEVYIEQCIDSIVNQICHYQLELIIIDDGSTDNTGTLLKKYIKSEHIKIITQKNHGLGFSRNVGLSEASGKYIMFVDADDVLQKGIIEQMLNGALRSRADIIDANYSFIYQNQIYNTLAWKKELIDLKVMPECIFESEGFPWLKIYKRELFHGAFFPENVLFEDTLIRMIIMQRAHTYYRLNCYGYCYRKHSNSIVANCIKKHQGLDAVLTVIYLLKLQEQLNLQWNPTLYKVILLQLTKYLYPRIRYLSDSNLRQVLLYCRDGIMKVHKSSCKLPMKYRLLQDSILKLDLEGWKQLSCLY